MATSAIRLAAMPTSGHDLHMVVDFENDGNTVQVLTACGKVIQPAMLLEVSTHQISCSRCRSVAKQYNYNLGYQTVEEDNANEIPF